MGELIFLGIVGTIILAPILFVSWVIRRISLCREQIATQIEEIATLRRQLVVLQSRVFHLEENVEMPTVAQTISPSEKVLKKAVPPKPFLPAEKPVAEKPVESFEPRYGEDQGSGVPGMIEETASASLPEIPAMESATLARKDETKPERKALKEMEKKALPTDLAGALRKDSGLPSPRGQDWESLIGGDLMNKMGALLLVIGLVLFLSYSLASVGPLVKLAVGAILSLLLLAWGVVQNQREGGQMMSIGLIGAGWAGLYATAFASHGLAATKVIESPQAAMVLLLLVATGMIVHSLKFASETTTGLAFIIAFVALFVGEVSAFSEIAAVILGISMLAISLKHSWDQIAVSGVVLTYGSMLLRFWLHTPPSGLPVLERVMFIQGLLLVYWVSFEAMGMIFLRRHPLEDRPMRLLFSLNFTCYLIVSLAMWPDQAQMSWAYLAGLVGIQYVVDCLARGYWFQNPGEAAIEKARFLQGSAEDALVLCAFSTCVWLWYVLPAPVVAIGWGIVGLTLVEIAVRLPWQFLRFAGHLIMTVTFCRVFVANFPLEGYSGGVSHRILSVVPLIALMAHLYLRSCQTLGWESAPTGGTKVFAPVYLYFATGLAAFLVRFEFGPGLMAMLWGGMAAVLALLGNTTQNIHLRRQGVLLAFGAVAYGFSTDLKNGAGFGLLANPWLLGLGSAACLYAGKFLSHPARTTEAEGGSLLDSYANEVFSLGGSAILAFLLYTQISEGLLTVAWIVMGVSLLGAGFFLKDRVFRFTGLGLALLCILKIFLYDSRNLDAPLRILAFIALGFALLGISWAYNRFRDKFQELF